MPYSRAGAAAGLTSLVSGMNGVPHIFCPTHQRGENLVVVLASAQIARDSIGQLGSGRIGVRLEKRHRRHDETGHAECALKPLLIDDTLLNRMQSSVSVRQPFDRQNF